jgi:hypothetical protein
MLRGCLQKWVKFEGLMKLSLKNYKGFTFNTFNTFFFFFFKEILYFLLTLSFNQQVSQEVAQSVGITSNKTDATSLNSSTSCTDMSKK